MSTYSNKVFVLCHILNFKKLISNLSLNNWRKILKKKPAVPLGELSLELVGSSG